MRQGELLRMRWTDINTDLKVVHLPLTKNGHPRTIPLSEKAFQVLEKISQDDSTKPVFSTTGEAIKRSWCRAVDRSGIVDFHFHDLRHEAISRFFELGLSIPEVALISGHRDTHMLFRCTHLKAENVGTKIAQLQMAIGK
jgi:integrase